MYQQTKVLLIIGFAFFVHAGAWAAQSAEIKSGSGTFQFKNDRFYIEKRGRKVIELETIAFNYETVKHWQVQAHTAQEIILLGEVPAAADFYRAVTDQEKRYIRMTVSAVADGFRLYAAPGWGRQVSLQFDYLGDHFFGLSAPLQPNNQLTPDLSGYSTLVDVYSEGASYRENYASAFSSFYISSNGYGAFFDSFARGRYSFDINKKNTIHHDTGTLDWYVFLGDDGAAIHRAYYDVIGAPKSVPLWALGPVGWRDQNNGGAQEILDDVEKLSKMKIPFTSWFVDRPYSDGEHAWSQMNFNEQFAKPEDWIEILNTKYNLQFMTWVSPATFGDERFNKHLPGQFSYIDLSDELSVAAYQEDLAEKHYAVGVKGHKIDRADEGFPVSEAWRDETPVAERRNKYAYLMAKIHDEAASEAWGADQVTFARTAIHRTQAFLSAIWGGDPRTTWEGLQGNMANAIRSSYMGFPVWGTDVGGYQGVGYIPEDLYTRWMQFGSMTGLFEIKLDGAGGEGKDRMPWQYNKAFQERFKKICDERMDLLPYLYSLANTSKDSGVMMQPLAYRHLQDKNTYGIWDQFYLGEAIMVAPIVDASNRRSVYFPDGLWRNFAKPSEVFEGGREYIFNVPLDIMPRFIKDNSIYVSGRVYWGSDLLWRKQIEPLTVQVFPAQKRGSTFFNYVDGLDNNKKKKMSLTRDGKIIKFTSPVVKKLGRIEVFLEEQPLEVSLNSEIVANTYDAQTQTLTVIVSQAQSVDLSILLK